MCNVIECVYGIVQKGEKPKNFNQLEYFCTAVRCQSLTQAAKKLYVTQPAISGAIRELEKEFSVNLFSHTRSKLVLTEDGQRFYERAEQLLRDVETAKLQLHDLGGSRQPVCVGIPPLWGTTFFPDLLHDFREKYPDIRLTFYEYGSARAAALGFRRSELIAILIMTGSPTTVASFVMAKSMHADGVLASNAVLLSTILSSVSITFWLYLLRSFGLI